MVFVLGCGWCFCGGWYVGLLHVAGGIVVFVLGCGWCFCGGWYVGLLHVAGGINVVSRLGFCAGRARVGAMPVLVLEGVQRGLVGLQWLQLKPVITALPCSIPYHTIPCCAKRSHTIPYTQCMPPVQVWYGMVDICDGWHGRGWQELGNRRVPLLTPWYGMVWP